MPSVAEEPLRKWPREERVAISCFRLVKISGCYETADQGESSCYADLVKEGRGQGEAGSYLQMFLAFGSLPSVMSGVCSND